MTGPLPEPATLLIPFAATDDENFQAALRALALPHLARLLAHMTPTRRDSGDAASLSPPHERVLARCLGMAADDGKIPWAAWQVAQHHAGLTAQDGGAAHHAATATVTPPDDAWAWITPCHWVPGIGRMTMADPTTLALDEADSRTLLAALQPWFAEDGITLQYDTPGRWLARGAVFADLATASLDRVAGREVADWMPRGPEAALLRRLQSEMQMLLYTHPVNDARAQRGLPPVNSFWVSGAGALAASLPVRPLGPVQVRVVRELAPAALQRDGAAWAHAWTALDATEVAALWATLQRTGRARLVLCGEHSALTLEAGPRSLLQKISSFFGTNPPSDIFSSL